MADTGANSIKDSIFKINTDGGIGIKFTIFPLNGKTLSIWIKAAIRGLKTQGVFGSVYSNIQPPMEGIKEYNEWFYADTMDAKNLWEAINWRFVRKENVLRIYDLKQDFQSLNLKNGDFLNYSNKVKETWDEIHALCTPATNPDELEREKMKNLVMSLLSSLGFEFSELRYNILKSKEMPFYDEVICVVEKEISTRKLYDIPKAATVALVEETKENV
ncbi:hypothetical protein ACH5RR_002641 [Cinchona calisaya]|uniref:Uncharacterized protein n=1 Tax=Cinchona calisaya TaxID=153742 RepID=A0ABD3ASJ7_9GENT